MLNFLLNNVSLLEAVNDPTEFCASISKLLRLVGIVVFGIKVVVPIILIIVGMLDLTKAVTEKNEENIKKAQQALVKKAIAAVCVFLVVTIVGVLMRIVGSDDYKDCMDCITDVWNCEVQE